MTFELKLLPKINLDQITTPDHRYYITKDGTQLSSVTTVLGRIPSKRAALERWQERVGIEEAERIRNYAGYRGSIIHDALEKYILGDPTYRDDLMPIYTDPILQFKTFLDKNVSTVYGVEQRLFSTEMQIAGTADLICLWNGIPTIVDFKTSKNQKSEKHMTSYFLQSIAYALMAKERFDLSIDQICILIYIDNQHVVPFYKNVSELEDSTREIFKRLIML